MFDNIPVFGMMIMHGGFLIATRDSSGYSDWPQSKAKKRFISFRRRSLQCSPCYDKKDTLSFLTRGAARRGVRWGRTLIAGDLANIMGYKIRLSFFTLHKLISFICSLKASGLTLIYCFPKQ